MSVERDLLSRLGPLVERQALQHGLYTPIEGLMVARFVSPSEPLATVQHPVYSVVIQGIKEALIGNQVVRYNAGNSLVAGVDLPVSSHIVEASNERPYLSVSLALDYGIIYDLLGDQPSPPAAQNVTPFEVRAFDPSLSDPLVRMLELLDHPEDIPVLAPLITREITWRLLQGPFSNLLRQLSRPEGHIARIARATKWIRDNYAEPLRVAELADRVNMSIPSFHRHFKSVTTVSPLQFQKQARLHLARRRLLETEGIGQIAYEVGYESLSQFNRDYRKLYGLPPREDIANLRQELQLAPATS